MKLTANIKLETTPEQFASLKKTLEACNSACNYGSVIAFNTKAFGQFQLQKLIYRDIRERFKLSAQSTVRCIAKIADSYKLNKKSPTQFKKLSAQPYDDRIFRLMSDDNISIWTLNGREKIPFKCGNYQRELLKTRKGEVDLMLIEGIFYIGCVCDVEESTIQNPTSILGVDLGIVNIAVDSEGQHYSGRDIEIYRKKFSNRRKNLQRKGTQSAKRKLKKIAKKQSRFQKDKNHCVSKIIVAKAQRLCASIALEDLTGIRKNTKARKLQRAKMSNWGFYQLKSFISYKAKRLGVLITEVDPRNTSRTCPKCKFVSKKNRPTRDKFCCQQCGFSGSADLIASWNIRDKAAVIRPMVGEMVPA